MVQVSKVKKAFNESGVQISAESVNMISDVSLTLLSLANLFMEMWSKISMEFHVVIIFYISAGIAI